MSGDGRPFSLLSFGSRAKEPFCLPVRVSSAGCKVWAGEKGRPSMEAIGQLCDGGGEELLGTAFYYGSTPDELSLGLDAGWTDEKHFDQPDRNGKKGVQSRRRWKLKCSRLVFVQNCVLVPWGASKPECRVVKFAGRGPVWFAPRNSGARPSVAEQSNRPFCGPAGDIAGWVGSTYADWRRIGYEERSNRGLAQDEANKILRYVGDPDHPWATSVVRDIWGLTDFFLLYHVEFKRTWDNNHEETDSDATPYAQRPDKVVYWRKTGGHASSDGNCEGALEAMRIEGDDGLQMPDEMLLKDCLGNPGDGCAFDLALLMHNYVQLEWSRSRDANNSTNRKFGNPRETAHCVQIIPHIRRVKALPPAGWRGGGA